MTQQRVAGIVLLGDIAMVNSVMRFTSVIRKEGCLELATSVIIDFRISCRLRTSSAPRITVTRRNWCGKEKAWNAVKALNP